MKKILASTIVILAFGFCGQTQAQSFSSPAVLNLSISIPTLSISEGTLNAIQFRKKKSKLLTIADFTLQPKTVFLCCTKGGYGFYFKF